MAYGSPTTLDPTNVMGRRIGAWFIDLIPAIVLSAVVIGTNLTTQDNVGPGFCSNYRATHSSSLCFQSGNSATYAPNFQGRSILLSLVYWFAVAGFLQGATGATIGKHIVGLRVVDQNGNLCGLGKALLRTLIGAFELGFCFLIGLITALVSHPHRRLGDLAAGTFVVAKESVGTPIATQMGVAAYPGAWTPPPSGQAWTPPPTGSAPTWGAPPPGWGTPPASAPPASAPTQTWGTPAASPPVTQPAAQPPATDAPAATPSDDAPGWGAPAQQQPQPQPAPAAEAAPAGQKREAQWDAQRNAWVFWQAETSSWLQFDPGTGRWGPLR